MRFLKDGPSIPDDLLIARDQGRVVLFCGAGVSRAFAKLPGFFDLARSVIHKLSVPPDHAAAKVLSVAEEIQERIDAPPGLISADRVFALLERDFSVSDIHDAVAKSLCPSSDADLSAHLILIRLARTPVGKVHLVTTNFDRLFEECSDTLTSSRPPRLPDPNRPGDLDGIIHLHGCVTRDYTGAEGDEFVLSSAEFGRAYLSDGWATQFFRRVLDRYVVLFVGYAADDPPVQYLLEALNTKSGAASYIYAFQAGLGSEASARWEHKGVRAIPYSADDRHKALWDTLKEWAARADNPDAWYDSVIQLARQGPEQLQAYQRGQIAHLISTAEGSRKFLDGEGPPPADWLCVFDPKIRYGEPGYVERFSEQSRFVDPFDLYGLDSDEAPERIDPKDRWTRRNVPGGAWDGLAANRLDRQNLADQNVASVRSALPGNVTKLAPRLIAICDWIAKVGRQPAAAWWAAGQATVHPYLQDSVRWQLRRTETGSGSVIRLVWRYLFEGWDANRIDRDDRRYELQKSVDEDGWNSIAVRDLFTNSRPYLKFGRSRWSGPVPPKLRSDIRIWDMLDPDVEYPNPQQKPPITNEWLGLAVRELRKNLEHAVQLESEIGPYGLNVVAPIVPESETSDGYARIHGLSDTVLWFSSLFERLIGLDPSLAKREFAAWILGDPVFTRLRIWVCGKSKVISARVAGRILSELEDDAFWDPHHQRDLLFVIAARWQELGQKTRRGIERRILRARAKSEYEDDYDYQKRKAAASLNRIHWLAQKGCRFTFDLEAESDRLRKAVPEWKTEYAASAAESMEGGAGWVVTETDDSLLLNAPLANVLTKAEDLRKKGGSFVVDRDPFAGLSASHPVLAFSALSHTAKRDQYPEWAWRTFLQAEARKSDKLKFSALIAERISRYPDQAVAGFIHPASDWLLRTGKDLSSRFPATFEKILSKLISVVRTKPPGSESAILRGRSEPDWVAEAINAPVGKLAQVLMADERIDALRENQGFPSEWLVHVEALLHLDGDLRRHALVIFTHQLVWFYSKDLIWTEANLLSILEGSSDEDRMAMWSGFSWAAAMPPPKLYLRLKPALLQLAAGRSVSRGGHVGVLAGIVLAGWGSINQETGQAFISNQELNQVILRADEEFRLRMIWQIKKWAESSVPEQPPNWSVKIIELFRNAWPRQKSAKTPAVSAQLCGLAFSNPERFPQIVEVILPLLTHTDRLDVLLFEVERSASNLVSQYPEQILALLYKALPDNVANWPYGIEPVLRRIGEADDRLKLDERFVELNRKWNSR